MSAIKEIKLRVPFELFMAIEKTIGAEKISINKFFCLAAAKYVEADALIEEIFRVRPGRPAVQTVTAAASTASASTLALPEIATSVRLGALPPERDDMWED